MFRTDVLRKFGFSDRTKVEDLDLTWTLVANGYRIRQANRCIVYPQECNSPREEAPLAALDCGLRGLYAPA